MLWIGLTGSMGSGKSAVAEILREMGFSVLDADAEARQALAKGSPASAEVVRAFGPDLLTSTGEIDRARLGQLVFGAPEKLQQLEKIVHPVVQKSVREQRERLARIGVEAAFYDVPLLFEKNLESHFDRILVVNAPLESMIERVRARSGLSREQCLARLSNQLPLSEKCKRADCVIENSGTLENLRSEVRKALGALGLLPVANQP